MCTCEYKLKNYSDEAIDWIFLRFRRDFRSENVERGDLIFYVRTTRRNFASFHWIHCHIIKIQLAIALGKNDDDDAFRYLMWVHSLVRCSSFFIAHEFPVEYAKLMVRNDAVSEAHSVEWTRIRFVYFH